MRWGRPIGAIVECAIDLVITSEVAEFSAAALPRQGVAPAECDSQGAQHFSGRN
jgi:hypothetical protein